MNMKAISMLECTALREGGSQTNIVKVRAISIQVTVISMLENETNTLVVHNFEILNWKNDKRTRKKEKG